MSGNRAVSCFVVAIAALLGAAARAETVVVKYVGEVDLAPFTCQFTESSFIERICYDATASRMLIRMKPATWYEYCFVPSTVFEGLRAAQSKGRYYNEAIKGRYGCQTAHPPESPGSEDRP